MNELSQIIALHPSNIIIKDSSLVLALECDDFVLIQGRKDGNVIQSHPQKAQVTVMKSLQEQLDDIKERDADCIKRVKQ